MATEQRLPEVLVKEAIGAGLESPMRESILEAVEDAEGSRRSASIPLVVGAGAVGAAIGYLLGSSETSPVQPAAESLPVDAPEPVTEATSDDEAADETGGSWLARVATLVAVAAAVAYLRRRRAADDEGWEPIDEVESPTEEAASIVDTIADEGETDAESSAEEDGGTGDASGASGDSGTDDDSDGETTQESGADDDEGSDS